MSTNPLMSKVKLPGRVFNLPSRGIFYKPGVLAEHVKDGEIQVKPMSALTEIKLRSADLLMSGKVLREVCQECAPEILDPGRLITKDVDALFTFLVVSTYGSAKTERSIHTCEGAKEHDYVVQLENVIGNPRNEGLANRDLMYTVVISTGQRVILRPTEFNDSLELLNLRQALARKEAEGKHVTSAEIEQTMIFDLLCVIEAVEDQETQVRVTDRGFIAEWVRALSRLDTEKIVQTIEESSKWGFQFGVNLTCKDCGTEYEHELDLNPINFFSG